MWVDGGIWLDASMINARRPTPTTKNTHTLKKINKKIQQAQLLAAAATVEASEAQARGAQEEAAALKAGLKRERMGREEAEARLRGLTGAYWRQRAVLGRVMEVCCWVVVFLGVYAYRAPRCGVCVSPSNRSTITAITNPLT